METKKYQGHLAMFTANFIWGIMSPVSKAVFAVGFISAFSLTSMRILGAALVFWLASLFMKKEYVNHRDHLWLFFASLFGITFNQGLFIVGLSYTTPIDATVVATTTPIITMLLAAVYLKEPVTFKKAIGTCMGLTGALILILGGHRDNVVSGGVNPLLGNILCLCAETSFAIYFVYFKGLISRYSPVTLMKWMFLYATICCLPFTGKELLSVPYELMSWNIWSDIVFIVLGATFLSYLLVPVGQHRLRPTVVSMYNYVQPVVAALLAIYWGMDKFNWIKAVAIALVFSGVYVVTQSKSRAQLETEKAMPG